MSDDLNGLKFSFPAAVLKRAPTNEMLELAKSTAAMDESVFEEMKPFFWRAEISNNRVDSYYTHMGESTLRNFVSDLSRGISFQDSHECERLGLGRSLKGNLEEADGVIRVLGDFFTIRGLKFNGGSFQTSDDFINAVRAGIASDVSQGFYFLNTDPTIFTGFRCDICKRDLMRDWDCPHIPGLKYEVSEEGQPVRMVISTATVENAHASEVSAVYSASTPGAAIMKAMQESEGGRMKPETARFLEQRYRSLNLKLPDTRTLVAVGNKSTMEVDSMNPEKNTQEPTTQERSEGSSLLEVQMRSVSELVSQSTAPKDLSDVEKVRWLDTECKRLLPLAEDGKRYREDLLTEALAEGVRAFGTDFKEETYRAMLVGAPIETIKQTRDDWARIAKNIFPGGRKTADETQEPVVERESKAHNLAFQA